MLNPDQKPLLRYLKPLIWVLLIATLVFLYFIPDAIRYSDYRIIRYIPFPLIAGLIPFLIVTSFYLDERKMKAGYIIIAVLTAFIICVAFNIIQNNKETDYLNTYGIHGKAIVSNQKIDYRSNSIHGQSRCTFTVNGRRYETLYFIDDKKIYKIGDTLDILYNQDYPKMYKLDTKRLYE
jgi:hypothetical protein